MINVKLTIFVFVCIFLFNDCSRRTGTIIDRIIEPKLSFLDATSMTTTKASLVSVGGEGSESGAMKNTKMVCLYIT